MDLSEVATLLTKNQTGRKRIVLDVSSDLFDKIEEVNHDFVVFGNVKNIFPDDHEDIGIRPFAMFFRGGFKFLVISRQPYYSFKLKM